MNALILEPVLLKFLVIAEVWILVIAIHQTCGFFPYEWQREKRALFWANYNDLSRRLVTLNGRLVRESPQDPLNSGLGIIVICPALW